MSRWATVSPSVAPFPPDLLRNSRTSDPQRLPVLRIAGTALGQVAKMPVGQLWRLRSAEFLSDGREYRDVQRAARRVGRVVDRHLDDERGGLIGAPR